MAQSDNVRLPPRTVKFQFPKVPDFTDPNYESTNIDHFLLAYEQQKRERFVISTEVEELREQTRQCIIKNSVNNRFVCRPLLSAYWKRINCANQVCEDDPRYSSQLVKFSPGKFDFWEPDQFLEEVFRNRGKKFAVDRYD